MEYLIGGIVIGSVFTVVALAGMTLKYRQAAKQFALSAQLWRGKYELLQDYTSVQRALEGDE